MTRTFTIRGHKVKSASIRRFIVVKVTTDAWCVMEEVEHRTISGGSYRSHEVVTDARGFRMIFADEAEAIEAAGEGQVVKVWSRAGAQIEKRSDSISTARAHASRIGRCVVVDTTTGEEV